MSEGNPWVRSGSIDVEGRSGQRGSWMPTSPVSVGASVKIEKRTGPAAPQPHVEPLDGGLVARRQHASAVLWVVGAHGGAGESTLAGLDETWMPAGHAWPELPWGAVAPCVVVARTNVNGLLAARSALTQWAASRTGARVELLGLVLIADAPGKLPAALRDLATVVGGGAPRVWSVPWVESWRLGDPPAENLPRPVSTLVGVLRSLTATATAVVDTRQKGQS